MSGQRPLLDTAPRQKRGKRVGLTSVCPAHLLVLEAAVLQAREREGG
jgi:D-tagatose-1,6-bisphosphate aldolase subunit GatZ/KbaZ